MQRLWPIATLLCAAALAWMTVDNRRLRAELRGREAPAPTSAAERPSDTSDGQDAGSSRATPRAGLWSRLTSARKRPELAPEPTETRAERRQRRSQEMRELLGRRPGESEEDYLARVRPFVVAGLAEPRTRLEQARAEAERAANVSDEQRGQLDKVLEDVYSEALDLANDAIAKGDLDPYRRNWSGALSVAGGFGAILASADQRIADILSPEQRQALYDAGFEWGEYIGVNAPWERLAPPPPPP